MYCNSVFQVVYAYTVSSCMFLDPHFVNTYGKSCYYKRLRKEGMKVKIFEEDIYLLD